MKKSLIALAVLAASGAAMAQSTVTAYGLLDVWFGSVKVDDGKGSSLTTTKLDSGGVDTSRWGLKGSEDLGGGLKANFKLEQGIQLDTGASNATYTDIAGTKAANAAFSRYSYVGFSGGFGEVKLGKTGTAYDDVSGASDAMFDSAALAPMNIVFKSTGYQWNPANTIYYATPTVSGFSGAVSYSLGENNSPVLSATSIASLNAAYAAGPLAVQLGYQVETSQALNAVDAKFTRLGASYNFGVATVKATYGNVNSIANVNGANATEYQVGVDFPVSSTIIVSTSYASSKTDAFAGNGNVEEKRSGFGIDGVYVLSKRTFLYAGFTNDSFSQVNAGDMKVTAIAVGVHHTF